MLEKAELTLIIMLSKTKKVITTHLIVLCSVASRKLFYSIAWRVGTLSLQFVPPAEGGGMEIIMSENPDKYIKMLEKEGADPAILIDPREVATAPWTVFKCQFGCSSYGHNHCCPPKAPSYDKTRKILDCYSTGILFRIHGWNATAMAFRCSREIFLDGYYKTIAFGSGMCKLCQSCDPAGCRQPERAIPSMEACGIDVFATARHFGLEIDTLRCPDEKRNHFGLVLIE